MNDPDPKFGDVHAWGKHDGINKHVSHSAGENNRQAKLTREKVLAIKQAIADGEANTVIARRFEVDRRLVSHIKNGRRWSSVRLP